MKWSFSFALGTAAGALFFALSAALSRAAEAPIVLRVDASKAPTQNVVFTRETIPVRPGKLVLYYPEWIPGQHQPVGPIANFAGLAIEAGGANLPWHREPHDLFAFDVDVPAGATSLDVKATYLGATFGHYSSSRLATPNLLVVTWDQTCSIRRPARSRIRSSCAVDRAARERLAFATALTGAQRSGNVVDFDACRSSI